MSVYDDSLGVMLISILILAALWGIATTLVISYFQASYKDDLMMRLLIASTWFCMTVIFCFLSVGAYRDMVKDFGNIDVLLRTRVEWPIPVAAFISIFMTFMIRILLARRLHILSNGNTLLLYVMSILFVFTFTCKIVIVIETIRQPSFVDTTVPAGLWAALFATVIVIDILDAISICYYLHRSRSPIRGQLNYVVNRISLYVLSTAITLVLYLCACLALAWFATIKVVISSMAFVLTSCVNFISYMLIMSRREAFQARLQQSVHMSDVIFQQMSLDLRLETASTDPD